MSTFEIAQVAFRGNISGANGTVKFHLNAGTVNAVNTINIASGAVSHETLITVSNVYLPPYSIPGNTGGNTVMNVNFINAEDGSRASVIEFRMNHLHSAFLNGSEIEIVNVGGYKSTAIEPFMYRSLLNPGIHNFQIKSLRYNQANFLTHVSGYLKVRYFRKTGG